jgi:hypothetical protein
MLSNAIDIIAALSSEMPFAKVMVGISEVRGAGKFASPTQSLVYDDSGRT